MEMHKLEAQASGRDVTRAFADQRPIQPIFIFCRTSCIQKVKRGLRRQIDKYSTFSLQLRLSERLDRDSAYASPTAKMVEASELKAMNWPFKNPKYIFFTDFDGTITLKDSNDFMVCYSMLCCSMGVVDRQARQTT